MTGVRRLSAGGLVIAMTAVAMLAWWSMLTAERAALRAAESGARQTAIVAALAIRSAEAGGEDLEGVVALAEEVGDVRLLVRDHDGDIAGSAVGDGRLVEVSVPGERMTVAVEIDPSAGLGLGRYSRFIGAAALVVMGLAGAMLRITVRDRRRAHAEVQRLGRRWEEAAAADELTGLGNRIRFGQDAEALIARGGRYGNAFGLALLELDGAVSDGLLLAVAESVAAEARAGDLCYRLEGGRFVTLLPEQDQTGSALAADRIRRTLSARLGQPVRSGSAAFTPWLPCTATDLLARAEEDLSEPAGLTSAGAGAPGVVAPPP